MIPQVRRLRLEHRGAPVSLVRRSDGRMSAEVRVPRREGLNEYMEVFTPENPRGERREIVIPPVPPSRRIPIDDGLLQ